MATIWTITRRCRCRSRAPRNSMMRFCRALPLTIVALASLGCGCAFAHGVAGKDAAFIESVQGAAIGPFLYLGAKHMITGYDHLLFLFGVIFFLYRLKD